jgi:hypothetical protein
MEHKPPGESDYNSSSFRKWLDILQQESWQLELIISGFSLYALFTSFTPISLEIKRAVAFENNVKVYFMTFLLAAVFILILNLTAHVILRGLWIGAIGLRYVSGEIDYDELKYTTRVKGFLEKKVGPYDRFIAQLEKYCSVIFASAFLTVFYILAFDPGPIRTIVQVIVVLILGVGALLTFIDFVTLGGLKKKRILFMIYYPYYRLFSILTLSFVYRPIVYNLLDHRFGRRLAMTLIPTYIVVILLTSVNTVNSNYVPFNFEDTFLRLELFGTVASPLNYEDELGDDKFARFLSIPSKTITTDYLEVFIPFGEPIEESVYKAYPDMIPENDQRGIMTSVIRFEERTLQEKRDMTGKYLQAISELYRFRIDSVEYKGEFVIAQNSKEQAGFETILSIDDLPRGLHLLELFHVSEEKENTIALVPFWSL